MSFWITSLRDSPPEVCVHVYGVSIHTWVQCWHTSLPGPVRHFMELVVNGLSKNPYYTVEEKHQFIDEYRRFFNKYSLEELQAETHTTRTEHHASVTS